MTLIVQIAAGIVLAAVGGFVLIFVLSLLVDAMRPKPKYVPFGTVKKDPNEIIVTAKDVDRPL